MRCTPKNENELQNLLPEGTYTFVVRKATEKLSGPASKNPGTEYISLQLEIWVGDTLRCCIFDNIMDSMPAKLRHCCDACGILDKYQDGELMSFDFEGKSGQVNLIIKKDKTGQYPDKNEVKDYVLRGGSHIATHVGILPTSDDIPTPFDDDPFGGIDVSGR